MCRFLFLSFCLFSLLAAQCFGLDPGRTLPQYLLRTWTSDNGLPQNSIRAMHETRDGFLWIGTRGGLARFDGATFVVYRAGEANSIPGDSITGLAEDRDGSLWISTDCGLTRYSHGRFLTYDVRNGLPADSVWRITPDPLGGVWAVTWHSQLFHFDGAKVELYPSSLLQLPQKVNALLEDRQGTLWIATFDGLLAFDKQTGFRRFTASSGVAGPRTFALALACTGTLWVAGDGGLTRFEKGRFSVVHVPGLPTATVLAIDSNCMDSAVWTGSTGDGLFRVSTQGVEHLGVRQGLLSNEIWLLYFSREGSLWAGAVNGLNQISDGSVTSYKTSDGLPGSTACMQRSQGANGDLWFGCDRSFFHVSGGDLLPAKLMAPLGTLRAIPLWVRSYRQDLQGLVLVDDKGNAALCDARQKHPLPRIPWASIGTLLLARDGTIWVAGSNIGVRAYPPSGSPRAFNTSNGLDDNNVGALAEDASGTLWVGTLTGLSTIRRGVVSRVFLSAPITSIEASPDGSVWAGSESGLIYVPPFRAPIRLLTQHEGLPINTIAGIASDHQGNIWLSTQQGVVRMRKKEMLAIGSREPLTIYGTADGFHNAQARVNAAFCSNRGDPWFVTLDEIASIVPQKVHPELLAPAIVSSVELDDTALAIPSGSSLIVPPGRHRIAIRFTLPNFDIPSRLQFRYRLDGWDKQWNKAGVLRSAVYTGVPAGRYTLVVDHSDGYGHWNSPLSSLPVRVVPYFYETPWFLTLIAGLIAACIWHLHRTHVSRLSAELNARMHERARIARELHDTLLQGVLGVSMQMYAASQPSNANASVLSIVAHSSQRLREIAEQSRRAVEGLRLPQSGPGPLETAITAAISDMCLPVNVQAEVNSAGQHRDLAPAVQSEVEQIVKEAAINAVRHAEATLVRIDIVYQLSRFFVSISDNGCGIQPEIKERGREGHWGILGMRERAESIGGQLKILSHIPSGTVIELSLRGRDAYTCRLKQGKWLP